MATLAEGRLAPDLEREYVGSRVVAGDVEVVFAARDLRAVELGAQHGFFAVDRAGE